MTRAPGDDGLGGPNGLIPKAEHHYNELMRARREGPNYDPLKAPQRNPKERAMTMRQLHNEVVRLINEWEDAETRDEND